MIERGYLRTHPLKMLILPDIIMLSEKAISELAEASAKGLKVVIFGDFAKTDYYYQASDEFIRNRDLILKRSIRPTNANELTEMLIPALNTDVPEKLIAYKKSKGFTLYNMLANKVVNVEVPEEMRTGRLAVVNDTGQVVQIRNAGASIKVPLEAMRAGSVVLCREKTD